MILTGDKEFFKGIGQVKYEGPQSDNPLAFRWYDADKMVAGKSMKDHLRFAAHRSHFRGRQARDRHAINDDFAREGNEAEHGLSDR